MSDADTERARGVINRGIPEQVSPPVSAEMYFLPEPRSSLFISPLSKRELEAKQKAQENFKRYLRQQNIEDYWEEGWADLYDFHPKRFSIEPQPSTHGNIQNVVTQPQPTVPPLPGKDRPEDAVKPEPAPISITEEEPKGRATPGRRRGRQAARMRRGVRRKRGGSQTATEAPPPSPTASEDQQPDEPSPIVLPTIDLTKVKRKTPDAKTLLLRTIPGKLWSALSDSAPKVGHRKRPEWDPKYGGNVPSTAAEVVVSSTAEKIRRDRAITNETRSTSQAITGEPRGTKVPKNRTARDVINSTIGKIFKEAGYLPALKWIASDILPDPGPDKSTSTGVGGAGAGGGRRG